MADNEIKNINVLALAKIDPFVYDNYLTYLELSIALAKKLNESILIINSMTDIVNKIDTNFTDIYNQLEKITSDIEQVYIDLQTFEDRINANVENQFQIAYNRLVGLMNDYQTIFNNNLDNLRTDLENEIQRIELGDVKAYNPTTRRNRKCFKSNYGHI